MVNYILNKLSQLLRHHNGETIWLPKSNSEIDLKSDIILIGQQSNAVEQFLDVGEYAYPFQFQIPQNISPSFMQKEGRGVYAGTRYSLVSTFDPYFDSYFFYENYSKIEISINT